MSFCYLRYLLHQIFFSNEAPFGHGPVLVSLQSHITMSAPKAFVGSIGNQSSKFAALRAKMNEILAKMTGMTNKVASHRQIIAIS